jgi:hypothetical protein
MAEQQGEKCVFAEVTNSVSMVVPSFRTWVMEVFITGDDKKQEIQWQILPVLALRSRVSSDFSKFFPSGTRDTHTPNSCKQFRDEGWASEGETVITDLMVPGIEGETIEPFSSDSNMSRHAIIVDHPLGPSIKEQAGKILKELVGQLVSAHKLPPGVEVSEYK